VRNYLLVLKRPANLKVGVPNRASLRPIDDPYADGTDRLTGMIQR
jgi:hypothetical protein